MMNPTDTLPSGPDADGQPSMDGQDRASHLGLPFQLSTLTSLGDSSAIKRPSTGMATVSLLEHETEHCAGAKIQPPLASQRTSGS